MSTVQASGAQAATLGTEHDLVADETTAGVYVLAVDAADLTDDETLTLKIYGEARSGDTSRVVYQSTFYGDQAAPLLMSPAVPSPHHLRATLEQNGGTGRTFEWALYKL